MIELSLLTFSTFMSSVGIHNNQFDQIIGSSEMHEKCEGNLITFRLGQHISGPFRSILLWPNGTSHG